MYLWISTMTLSMYRFKYWDRILKYHPNFVDFSLNLLDTLGSIFSHFKILLFICQLYFKVLFFKENMVHRIKSIKDVNNISFINSNINFRKNCKQLYGKIKINANLKTYSSKKLKK